jgi:uncharacterized repeat protein (TIGR03943 family)
MVMFLLGAAVVHAGSTPLYVRYVKTGLRPLLLAAGITLIIAALGTVGLPWFRSGTSPRDQHPVHDDAHAGGHHGHGDGGPRIAWLLTLPFLALALIAPPALGSYSADHTGTALTPPLALPALPASGPLRLGVVDYADRAVYDHGRSLTGRTITLTGFVTFGTTGGGTVYLTRMILNCCAADAQPVKVALSGNVPPVLRPDAWLAVTGTYTTRRAKDPINGAPIPYLTVTRAAPTSTPKDPYES